MTLSEDITIIETKKIDVDSPIILEGVPDMGLVGSIAVSHMVLEQNFEEVGYIKSDLFAPVMVIHERKVLNPVRIFQKGKIIAILSEIPIDPKAGFLLAKKLTEWYKEKGAGLVISISGTPIQERLDIEEPEIFGTSNNEEILKKMEESGVKILEEGFVSGFYALIIKNSIELNLNSSILLAQCYPSYPDPGAAASILKTLNKMIDLNIDVKQLTEQAEELKVNYRTLMEQTNVSMQRESKVEVPTMYR
ncbi:MAG: PAC2 family protein [Candidatus Methanofastidiosum methylothiophilum]|uniref:PAC2 family protein n=1 Tax=Candidatus Methanofastidiosum methylothiophilum TaxID=1705564 RepID=A0A150IHB8_9EURY|nr:MAG: PAC2 family protein [Candidatus Methanofastidiosum methylthiophilus]KYC46535.1 MAG: PAC2 family protein [Candidatus Methanofastidiosum methylthiophilus]KYC51011.1 MAG: PAC2 family protein [Candidatus Methanofastidiosum methylthiophilus]